MLVDNNVLRKLELEGNLLGPNSAREFGKALKINKTLLLLDLESNQLASEDGGDPSGVIEFAKALCHNKHLLSLNVAFNQLKEECGKAFEDTLERNLIIIDFEFGFNDFHLTQVTFN
jgi:hypothetical protein